MKESKKLKSKHSFLEMGAYQMFAGGGGWHCHGRKGKEHTRHFPVFSFVLQRIGPYS